MGRNLHELVREGLDNLRASGVQRLPVDESARTVLRSWMRPASNAAAPTSASWPPVATRQANPRGRNNSPALASIELSAPAKGRALAPAPALSPAAAGASLEAPPAVASSAPSTPAAGTPAPGIPETVEEKLAFLRRKAENWQPARQLGTLRETMVFATGDPHAALMLVGEAPGYDEERLREPFVGKAGQKLNQILAAMGLAREAIYISNICKFRPSMPNQGTGNRPPTEEEIASCLPLVMAEIRAIRPKCIVCLGGTAAKGLLGAAGSVSSMRGAFHEVQGIPARVTYHPSYLLRNDTPAAKRAVWEDMLAVMECLGMPVSEKQKRYFLPRS